MNRLLVSTAADGSSLILGEEPVDPRRLVFQHEGHGPPELAWGALPGFWITVAGRPHIVFAGDTLDEPDVDRVQLEFPREVQLCPARRTKHRSVWMSSPVAFGDRAELRPGDAVRATFLAGDRIVNTACTDPLVWATPVPPPTPPRPSEWADAGSPENEPERWTGYAPNPDNAS